MGNNNSKMVYIFSIEGNIGSGKSTLLRTMSEKVTGISTPGCFFGYNNFPIIYLQEPVDTWNTIKDSKNDSILTNFYRDQAKYAFPFQMLAFISRVKLLKKTIEENPDAIIITERCIYTDKEVFAKMLYESGTLNEIEYSVYLKWYSYFTENVTINGIIYITTSPEDCLNRISTRSREGEGNIGIDYLIRCNDYHINWISSMPKVLILKDSLDYEKIVLFIKLKLT